MAWWRDRIRSLMSKRSTATLARAPVQPVASVTAGAVVIHGENFTGRHQPAHRDRRSHRSRHGRTCGPSPSARGRCRCGRCTRPARSSSTSRRRRCSTDITQFLEELVARDRYYRHNDPEHSDCDRAQRRLASARDAARPLADAADQRRGSGARAVAADADGGARRPAARARCGCRSSASSHDRACILASTHARLADIAEKVDARRAADVRGRRAAVRRRPICWRVGWLANRERERRHGARTYFNHNLRLEATNVCEASCLFCSFARLRPGDPGAHTMSVEQVLGKLRQRAHEPLTEIHIVNGLHPELPFDYYKDLLRGLKAIRPDVHLKCFTAVEIAFFADLYGMTDEQVLVELREAGLDSLPGGGAEIFARARAPQDLSRQVRRRSLPRHSSHRAPARHAHQRHDALRAHRDDGGARRSPAADPRAAGRDAAASRRSSRSRSIPTTTRCASCRRRRPATRCACTRSARLMLDNVDHIKAYWISSGVEVAQTALWFGADDLDGTVQEETIYHMAGSRTPSALSTDEIEAADSRRRPRADRARHALQRRARAGCGQARAARRQLAAGSATYAARRR